MYLNGPHLLDPLIHIQLFISYVQTLTSITHIHIQFHTNTHSSRDWNATNNQDYFFHIYIWIPFSDFTEFAARFWKVGQARYGRDGEG
jgi:hypothetical protein